MEGKSSFPCSQESTPLVRILSQTTPVYALPPYFINASSNIIIPPTPRSFKLSLSLLQTSPLKFCVHFYSSPHAPPISPTCFYHSNHIWWGVQMMAFLKMQPSATSPLSLPHESTYLPQHSVLEHVQPMFFLVTDQIPHQYKKTGEITVLYTSFVLILRWQMGRQNESATRFSKNLLYSVCF